MNALQRICGLRGTKNRRKMQDIIKIIKDHPEWINKEDENGQTPLMIFLQNCDGIPDGLESEVRHIVDLFLTELDLYHYDSNGNNIMHYIRQARLCKALVEGNKILLRYYIQDCLADRIDVFELRNGRRYAASMDDHIDSNIILWRFAKLEKSLKTITSQMKILHDEMSSIAKKVEDWDTFLD